MFCSRLHVSLSSGIRRGFATFTLCSVSADAERTVGGATAAANDLCQCDGPGFAAQVCVHAFNVTVASCRRKQHAVSCCTQALSRSMLLTLYRLPSGEIPTPSEQMSLAAVMLISMTLRLLLILVPVWVVFRVRYL